VRIQYKNETSQLVNIRGKKLKPGESIVSQVFIKHFEEDVKKGNLTIYVEDAKISFEEISVITEQIADDKPNEVKDDGKEPEAVKEPEPGKEPEAGDKTAPESAGEGEDTIVPETPDVTPETAIGKTERPKKTKKQLEASTGDSVEEPETRKDESAEEPVAEMETAGNDSGKSDTGDENSASDEAGEETAGQESAAEAETTAGDESDSAE
jgi:hypothetical protein